MKLYNLVMFVVALATILSFVSGKYAVTIAFFIGWFGSMYYDYLKSKNIF